MNGEAIYGSTVSPYGAPAWGRYTAKAGAVYAFVFDWPRNRRLPLTGVKTAPASVHLLGDPRRLSVESTANGYIVILPAAAPSSIATVLVLEDASGAKR